MEARDKLDAYADYMKRKPDTKIQVNGYTDDRGKASYNQMLSEKRANAVKAYLEEQGIDGGRIAAKEWVKPIQSLTMEPKQDVLKTVVLSWWLSNFDINNLIWKSGQWPLFYQYWLFDS